MRTSPRALNNSFGRIKMKTGECLAELERRFFEAIENKTGWGKNEIKLLHRQMEIQTLRYFDDLAEKDRQDA